MALRLVEKDISVDLGTSKIAQNFCSTLDEVVAVLWKTENRDLIPDVRGLRNLIDNALQD
jgi:hypothetical protein